MAWRRVAGLFLGASVLAAAPPAWPCGGTIRPICGQTIWLSQFAPRTIVHPGAGQDIELPIGVLPYAWWNTDAGCKQPGGATLEISVDITPIGGGATFSRDAVPVPVGTPTARGLQTVMTGPGGTPELGGEFRFVVPAGIVPTGDTYRCVATGTYTNTFLGPGEGAGMLTATSTTEIYISPPAAFDPAQPLLQFQRIDPDDKGLTVCRKGDQTMNFFLLANNDLENSLSVDFSTWSNQVARLPAADVPEFAFAVSMPDADTDSFGIVFADQFEPGKRVPEFDPTEITNRLISRPIVVPPGGIEIIPTWVGSHGMCAEGSACEVLARVEGHWLDEDRTPAAGCASTVTVVGDVAAKSPGCEVTSESRAAGDIRAEWTPISFDRGLEKPAFDPHLSAFAAGNALNDEGIRVTKNFGIGFFSEGFPIIVREGLRTREPPVGFSYDLTARQGPFRTLHLNQVNVILGAGFQGSFSMPLVMQDPITLARLDVNRPKNDVRLYTALLGNNTKLQLQARFTVEDLEQGNLPDGFEIDPNTRLDVDVDCSDNRLRFLSLGPFGTFPVFGPADADVFEFQIDPFFVDPLNPSDLTPPMTMTDDWTASSDSPAIDVLTSSGSADNPIQVQYDPSLLPALSTIDLGWIRVESPRTLNDGVDFPVAARRLPFTPQVPLPFDLLTGKLKLDHRIHVADGDAGGKDSLKLKFQTPIQQGFEFAGTQLFVGFGGFTFSFTLDDKGRSTPKDKTASAKVKAKRKKGVVQDGMATWTLKFKRRDLTGFLFDDGVVNTDVPKPGRDLAIPVRIDLNDDRFGIGPEFNYRSRANGKARLKATD